MTLTIRLFLLLGLLLSSFTLPSSPSIPSIHLLRPFPFHVAGI